MTLTARKVAHVQAMIPKVMAGRSQAVVLYLRQANGTNAMLTVNAVWRVVADGDPLYEGASNTRFTVGAEHAVEAIFSVADVSYSQLKSCVWATLGAGAQGAQPAVKYTLLDIEPVGMVPGGDRFYTKWTRQH